MKAIVIPDSPLRFATQKLFNQSSIHKSDRTILATLREIKEPVPPNEKWMVLNTIYSGICGSDLSLLMLKASPSLLPYLSFPLVPGHEIVAMDKKTNQKFVIKAALTCEPRGLELCEYCKSGYTDRCLQFQSGCLLEGLQIGYCKSANGGWAEKVMAHSSQLRPLPEDYDPLDALMVEPLTCAIHAVSSLAEVIGSREGQLIVINSAGTIGLLTLIVLKELFPHNRIIVAAKYDSQAQLANQFGGTEVTTPLHLKALVRKASQSFISGGALTSGADVAIDTLGTRKSILEMSEIVKPKGTIALLGMPGSEKVDLSLLWLKQINLRGVYSYGKTLINGNEVDDFKLAIDLARKHDLGQLVSAAYELEEYQEAISHAIHSGLRGGTKIAFKI